MRTVCVGLLLIGVILSSHATAVLAQQTSTPKRVVVLYWYDKNYPGHVRWDQGFRPVLEQGEEGSIEYYPEYLEANRFPGENQPQVLHDYLKEKYADRPIDVVVAQSDVSLNFLARYKDLFPNVPVVFYSATRPDPQVLAVWPNITGVVVFGGFEKTVQSALTIHPETEQLFVISGSLERDKRFEMRARDQLKDLEHRIKINYLTDVAPAELRATTSQLPKRSLILYVWQQSYDEHGKLVETGDLLSSIAQNSSVPIYAMSQPLMGRGIVGGYVYNPETSAARVAEMVRLIVHGRPARDIPIESVHTIPMFDWNALQRWKIGEDKLPAGSIIRFKQPTFREQYKHWVIGVLAALLLQTSFIMVLLVERRRRRRAKEALDRLNAELETRIESRTAALNAKSRELESFAYSVAHDLKAPLRGIEGYSRILVEEYSEKLDINGQSFLQTIQKSTDDMNQLIDDLLTYSRLERREMKTNRIELAPIVNALIDEKKRDSSARPIDFVVNVNGGTVLAEANGLGQSLRNYLDNAIKFTSRTSTPRIEVGAKENERTCLVWVQDNGIGFDMKYHDNIFDIFQRLNLAEEYPGTGIGLAIVRKAMQRMGGRAWAESTPGQGATFYLEIPK